MDVRKARWSRCAITCSRLLHGHALRARSSQTPRCSVALPRGSLLRSAGPPRRTSVARGRHERRSPVDERAGQGQAAGRRGGEASPRRESLAHPAAVAAECTHRAARAVRCRASGAARPSLSASCCQGADCAGAVGGRSGVASQRRRHCPGPSVCRPTRAGTRS